jgi:hypothetical protein
MLRKQRKRRDPMRALQLSSQAPGKVGHPAEFGLPSPMHPAEELGGPETLLAQSLDMSDERFVIEIEKVHSAWGF